MTYQSWWIRCVLYSKVHKNFFGIQLARQRKRIETTDTLTFTNFCLDSVLGQYNTKTCSMYILFKLGFSRASFEWYCLFVMHCVLEQSWISGIHKLLKINDTICMLVEQKKLVWDKTINNLTCFGKCYGNKFIVSNVRM